MKIKRTGLRQNDNDQTIWFDLTHNGETYSWHGDFDKNADPDEVLDQQKEKLMCGVYRKIYRDAPNDLISLDKWEDWIADGCKVEIPDGVDEDDNPKFKLTQVTPSEFKGTHPPEDKVAKMEERIKMLEAEIKNKVNK